MRLSERKVLKGGDSKKVLNIRDLADEFNASIRIRSETV